MRATLVPKMNSTRLSRQPSESLNKTKKMKTPEIDALCERLNVSSPAMALSEAEELKRGKMIVELLGLRKIREISKRRGIPIFQTSGGTKTELGLFRTVARVVLDGE